MEEVASGEPKESAEPSAPSRKAKRPSAEEEEAPRQPTVPAEPVAEPAVVRPQPPVPAAAEDEEEEARSRKEQPVSETRFVKKMSEKEKIQRRLGSKYNGPGVEDEPEKY